MAVPTVIVDGKTSTGKRVSVSVDAALWSLYVASRERCVKNARNQLKQRMASGQINNTYDAKRWIYSEIAKPTLLEELSDAFELS